MAVKDFTPIGSKFHRLTVIGLPTKEIGNRYRVLCACECGNEKNIICYQLVNGKTKSCGCLQRESQEKIHPTPIGKRFGLLVVIKKSESRRGDRIVEALCDCGNTTKANINNMRNGHTQSCGCLKLKPTHVTHGHTRKGKFNRTYSIYRDMRTRCENPNYKEFHLYGGRGITVCERWKSGYENFLADMGERPDGLTLERVDVNKGYSPENCKWATKIEQANNKRNSAFLTLNGETMTVAQWATKLKMNASTLYYRRSKGYTAENILSATLIK